MSNTECSFPKLGEFLELLMNRLKITKVRVLGDEHVGPDTYDTAIIITASPIAIPAIAMRTAGRDTCFPPSLSR